MVTRWRELGFMGDGGYGIPQSVAAALQIAWSMRADRVFGTHTPSHALIAADAEGADVDVPLSLGSDRCWISRGRGRLPGKPTVCPKSSWNWHWPAKKRKFGGEGRQPRHIIEGCIETIAHRIRG
jgi:hypothetical protein